MPPFLRVCSHSPPPLFLALCPLPLPEPPLLPTPVEEDGDGEEDCVGGCGREEEEEGELLFGLATSLVTPKG